MEAKDDYLISKQPQKPNFALAFDGTEIQLEFTVKKTLKAKIKYWLFCKFFPFRIIRWDV